MRRARAGSAALALTLVITALLVLCTPATVAAAPSFCKYCRYLDSCGVDCEVRCPECAVNPRRHPNCDLCSYCKYCGPGKLACNHLCGDSIIASVWDSASSLFAGTEDPESLAAGVDMDALDDRLSRVESQHDEL